MHLGLRQILGPLMSFHGRHRCFMWFFNVGCSVFIKYPDTGIASIHWLVPGLLQSITYIQRVVLGIVGFHVG